jgi:hypothetical protein
MESVREKCKGPQSKYTERIQENNTQTRSRTMKESTKIEILRTLTEIHSKSDLRKQSCSSKLVFSQSSKLQAYGISLQLHHIKQEGITFHTMFKSFWQNLPFQHAKSSTTLLQTSETPDSTTLLQYHTVKKKVIRSFPSLFTHTILIHHYHMTFAKIIHGDNFS